MDLRDVAAMMSRLTGFEGYFDFVNVTAQVKQCGLYVTTEKVTI